MLIVGTGPLAKSSLFFPARLETLGRHAGFFESLSHAVCYPLGIPRVLLTFQHGDVFWFSRELELIVGEHSQ